MEENKITLIIRIREGYSVACRCINSILRQSVDKYRICGIVYDENVAEKLKKTYKDIKFYTVSGNKGCCKKINSVISEAKTQYCMLVDSDSIVASNAVEQLYEKDSDVVVFNMSKVNAKEKFGIVYPDAAFKSVSDFMGYSQSVWALAYKTEFLVKNGIELKGMSYENQALFVLLCLSLAGGVSFCKDVLVYKWTVTPKKEISDLFYYKNREDIKRALKAFVKKDDIQAKAQTVRIFLMASIEESCNRSFLRKMKKMLSLIKLIWF